MSQNRTRLRLSELVEDTWIADGSKSTPEWPHPDYAEAAKHCTRPEDLEKLRGVCDDLECLLTDSFKPGAPARLCGSAWPQLSLHIDQCWREIICADSADKQLWTGIRRIGRAWRAQSMDTTTRRTGTIIHAVAIARLYSHGALEQLKPSHVAERSAVISKKYVPEFVRGILIAAKEVN